MSAPTCRALYTDAAGDTYACTRPIHDDAELHSDGVHVERLITDEEAQAMFGEVVQMVGVEVIEAARAAYRDPKSRK